MSDDVLERAKRNIEELDFLKPCTDIRGTIVALAAEVRALRAKAEKFGDLLVEIETVADENCTETGGIARGALFQIRSKIHQFAALSARGGEDGAK